MEVGSSSALSPERPPSSTPSFYRIWLAALTRPREETYQALGDDPNLTVGQAALWIGVSSLVGYGLAFLLQFAQFAELMRQASEQGGLEAISGMGVVISLLCLVPLVAVFAVAGQMIYVAILQFVASALGGAGSFRGLFVATAAYTAPVTLLTSALAAIPFVGGCLTLPLSLYALYLGALSIKSVNRFDWGHALLTLLVPLIISILIGVLIFFGLMVPLMEELMREAALVGAGLS